MIVVERHTDPQIPELVSLTEAAEIMGKSKAWLSRLYHDGVLLGQRVGHTVVLPLSDVHQLAATPHKDQPTAAAAPTTIPALLSTSETAERLGFAQRNWVRELWHRGVLPGQLVGTRTIVFLADTIDRLATQDAHLEQGRLARDNLHANH